MSREGAQHLRRSDPVLARVIEQVGAYRPSPPHRGSHFSALMRAIVYQQLSGKAASTILSRVHGLYAGRAPTPRQLLATPDSALRSAGLSTQKLGYLRDLAARVEDGRLPVARLSRLSDQQAIELLTGVKGIGRWSAQVY